MFRTTAGGSFSKNDLENSLSREELSSLIDGEDANERLPLRDVRSFPRKKSSTFSSKSPDGESTPSDEKLGSSVTGNNATKSSAERKLHTDGVAAFSFSPNGNRESSVIAFDKSKDTIAINIEPPVGNINKVSNITVTALSNEGEHYKLQELGGIPTHEVMHSRSSNLPSVAITSEYIKDESSCNDEETIRLFIECNNEFEDLRQKLADNKKSALTKCCSSKVRFSFALLSVVGCAANVYRIVHDATTEHTLLHHATIKRISPCNATIECTSPYNATIEYTSPPPGFNVGSIFGLIVSFTGLAIGLIYVCDQMLSRYRKKNSSLEERFDSCIKERDELKSKLPLQGGNNTGKNPTFVQLPESASDSVFKSFTEQQPGPSGYKPLPKLSEKEGAKGIRSFLNQSTSLSDVDVSQGASTEKTKL